MNTRTHALITNAVLTEILEQDLVNNRLKSEIFIYRDSIRTGCLIEDYPPPRTIFHGYNPYTKLGWGLLKTTAPVLATRYLNDAIRSYATNKARAYHKLGRIIHLIQDMGTPAHVHSYPHGIKDYYESFLRNNRKLVKGILGAGRGDYTNELTVSAPGERLSMQKLFHALAKHTYDMSSWNRLDGAFINKRDHSKYLAGEQGTRKARQAVYEPISDSWYLCGMLDDVSVDVCHWYALELLPLTITHVTELIKLFLQLTNQEVFANQQAPQPQLFTEVLAQTP